MKDLAADEMVVFSDAVHPEHQSRPAYGWFSKGQKTAWKATSGRKRLNIQGALDLDAEVLQPWLGSPERRVTMHFLPAYALILNPIERLWGVIHKWVTHNRNYAAFNQFTDAIFDFFRKTLSDNWHKFHDTVTDNFRFASLKHYKVI